jgi:hypothetical protein
VGGYICILIGGVGRRRERESGEILYVEREYEFGEAPCSLSRDTLVHRSDKTSAAKNTSILVIIIIIIIITNSHAFLNSLTESFGRTSDVTWSRLCSWPSLRLSSATGSVSSPPLRPTWQVMHASSSALLAKKAAVGQHELVRDSARHDRYELAADRPCASTMMSQSLLACLQVLYFRAH